MFYKINCTLTMIVMLLLFASPGGAQSQCGIAETINYPIDRNLFQLAQDFGTRSPRHQGRYHTGEDWFVAGGVSLGQPVRAAATGRVTYSAPTGWGRDGGVVIIEHVFADGTVVYTQYGHMMETEDAPFPARLSCIEAGDRIGSIGDARPAPHLHFEVRVNQPDIPGPGYSLEDPVDGGWRSPIATITDLQARLSSAYRWGVNTGIGSAPLVLDDYSLLVARDTTLRRITNDGRILWRVFTETPVVSIDGFQANPLVTYADGTLGRIDFEGNPTGDRWQVDFLPDSAPIQLGETLIYHTIDNTLTALTADRREVLWQLEDVPDYEHYFIGEVFIGLVTVEGELLLVSHAGEQIDRAMLEAGASFANLPDGSLLVYTLGGLWRVDTDGEWSQALDDDVEMPTGGGASAVATSPDGRIFLTDGERLYAYSRLGALDWQGSLPQIVTGRVAMTHIEDLLLIVSNHGHVITARDGGGICGSTRIYGDDGDQLWYERSEDGILRVLVGRQVIGLDWRQFNGAC